MYGLPRPPASDRTKPSLTPQANLPIVLGTMLFFRKRTTQTRVERLIREGVGVRESAWALPNLQDRQAADGLATEIVSWVRDGMGQMRRPYGIDHVALALACRDRAGDVLCSNSLGVVRPGAFYREEGPAAIAAFFDDLRAIPAPGGSEVVGALLSLGDIAYRLGQDGDALGRAA
ncbi:MAG: hypothetical protein HY875_13950 [Chloroflexi bacterium]|nr:hypothetical protein [Chloroflexota bacterium]